MWISYERAARSGRTAAGTTHNFRCLVYSMNAARVAITTHGHGARKDARRFRRLLRRSAHSSPPSPGGPQQ